MFKKLLLGLGITSLLAFAGLAVVNAAPPIDGGSFDTNAWFGVWTAWGLWVAWWDSWQWSGLIGVIKSFINWMLGLLSLIALVVLLYGGFNMVTAAWAEEKYKKGFKIMQQAWVWLAVIWLSWFVVSIIFWIIWWTTGTGIGV